MWMNRLGKPLRNFLTNRVSSMIAHNKAALEERPDNLLAKSSTVLGSFIFKFSNSDVKLSATLLTEEKTKNNSLPGSSRPGCSQSKCSQPSGRFSAQLGVESNQPIEVIEQFFNPLPWKFFGAFQPFRCVKTGCSSRDRIAEPEIGPLLWSGSLAEFLRGTDHSFGRVP
ncbi:hypothetical protein L1987_58050 [Smallanthus sonchifolius]|uniref:Uncharacterized protein n=1 Tax=Smallanthus sonchifolius TaxID=185202 RepID=A0ACB9DEQ5_9ASTR|nr:hypothetical protein L1987_58050 [Smallanthus sonchifolius]